LLPFGIQSTKLHLHTWKEDDFKSFEKFIKKNSKKVLTYDQVILKINDNFFYKSLRFITSIILKLKRFRLKKDSEYNIKEF